MNRIFLFLFFFSSFLSAQYVVTSADDGVGVPYATIIVSGTNFGTVTDFEGRFSLKNAPTADSLRLSAVGFASISYAISDLSELIPLLLQRTSYDLSAVEVKASAFTRSKTLGGTPKSDKLVCFFLHGQEGEQIGRRLKPGRECLAQSARISVVSTNADSVLCRLRFYPILNDTVSSSAVLHQDVFLTIDRAGIIEVDLKPYDIILPPEIVLAIELIDPPVPNQFIYFGGSLFKRNAIYRTHSASPWREGSTNKNVGKRGLITLAPGFELTVLR